jgi:hypothetical protein
MRKVLRENRLALGLAALASWAMAWLGLYGMAWNNYEYEAQPAFGALGHGHLLQFLRLAPAYGGSLIERAPFALLADAAGGGRLAVYRAVAVPGLMAVGLLGVWLVAEMRRAVPEHPRGTVGGWSAHRSVRGTPLLGARAARALVLALCVANPLTLLALEHGHSEELLGGALCVVAVLLASRSRAFWAGVVLGLAVANKEWAIVALGPVLIALAGAPARPGERSPRFGLLRARAVVPRLGSSARACVLCLSTTVATATAIVAPLVLVPGGQFASGAVAVASTPSKIFLPWSAWWFFGYHGPPVRNPFGTIEVGYRTAPSWIGPISHPSIIVAGLLLSALYWWVTRRRGPHAVPLDRGAPTLARPQWMTGRCAEPMLLLALVLLARCLLDTWDYVYYPLPFLLALLAWESARDPLHPPAIALVSTVLAWASFQWLPNLLSPDGQSLFFLAWTVPLALTLAARLYAPRPTAGLWHGLGRRFGGHAAWEGSAAAVGGGAAPHGLFTRSP